MSDNLSTIRRFSWIVYAAVILSLLLPSAFAQTTVGTGSIVGTVTDPSGAVVSGAKITWMLKNSLHAHFNNEFHSQVIECSSATDAGIR